MITLVLGILDVITSFVLITYVWLGWFTPEVVLYHALYVVLKGALFFMWDFASKVDLFAGVYIMLVAFSVFSNSALTAIVAFWLLQKGASSVLRPMMGLLL